MNNLWRRCLLGVGLGLLVACSKPGELVVDGNVVKPLPIGGSAGGEFRLSMPDQTVSLQDFAGEPLLIYFGFTHCPDICPASLAWIKQALPMVEAERVNVLFVSVDAVNDTPESVQAYAQSFGPEFVGAMGTTGQLHAMTQAYGMSYSFSADDAGAVSVTHASRTYVVDAKGQLVYILPHGTQPKQIADAIRYAAARN